MGKKFVQLKQGCRRRFIQQQRLKKKTLDKFIAGDLEPDSFYLWKPGCGGAIFAFLGQLTRVLKG